MAPTRLNQQPCFIGGKIVRDVDLVLLDVEPATRQALDKLMSVKKVQSHDYAIGGLLSGSDPLGSDPGMCCASIHPSGVHFKACSAA